MSIRVLVVDDSAFMRKILCDILMEDEDLEVIDTAKNGKEALEKIEKCRPDVITLDVEMPILDGLSTLKELTKLNKKIPTIMLSSLTAEGTKLTIEALELGAVDFITKPSSIFNLDAADKKIEITQKVKTVSRASIIQDRHISNIKQIPKKRRKVITKNDSFSTIIAIGTSTGGPRALQAILPNIPANIDASILVVQHMPPGFTKSLAKRLNTLSSIEVKEAENGEVLKRGCCYIAPGNQHMQIKYNKMKNLIIELNTEKNVSGHRPSVDVMMESVAGIRSLDKIGVILTGMGSDGALGLELLHKNNGFTIAQNEETCVVYGMPKSAIKLGCVDEITSLSSITGKIIDRVEG